ncbi:MAG: type II toxin-antitoxin system HicB family antitoxin [Solirubrobacterales bacterium]
MTTYGVIYEQGSDGSWHASAADLPVFACGDTREEAEREIRSAIAFHLEYLAEEGLPIPQVRSTVGTVTV